MFLFPKQAADVCFLIFPGDIWYRGSNKPIFYGSISTGPGLVATDHILMKFVYHRKINPMAFLNELDLPATQDASDIFKGLFIWIPYYQRSANKKWW